MNMTRRTISKPQLLQIVALSSTTIYTLEKDGDFPKRFYLTPRTPVWDHDEVLAWIEQRKAAPIKPDDGPDVKKRKSRPVKAQSAA